MVICDTCGHVTEVFDMGICNTCGHVTELFNMGVCDTCAHVTEVFKIFELVFGTDNEVRECKKTKNVLSRHLFYPPEPQLTSITTKINTEVKHYHKCVNS